VTGTPTSNIVGADMAVRRNPETPLTVLPPSANNTPPIARAASGAARPMTAPQRRIWWRYSWGPAGTWVRSRNEETISPSYGLEGIETARPWSDPAIVSLAVAAWLGARVAYAMPVPLAAVGVVAGLWRRSVALTTLAVLLLASGLAARAESGLVPALPGRVEGVAELVGDPAALGPGVSVVVRMGDQRYVIDAFGSPARRLRRLDAGAMIYVVGRQSPLSAKRAKRFVSKHVSSALDVERVTDLQASSRAALAANRLKGVLAQGAESMPDQERALFLGLVLGDDRDQERSMIDTFRATGLSHLTAASGQNVAFLLVALGPLLRSLRPGPRWAATLLVIAWFAVLTRFEPSVIRASAMAALSATAFWRGWKASPIRLLGLAVTACLLVDPLLVHSIGWWLSVGATTGIAVLSVPLRRRIRGPRWVAESLAVSLAAQVGVLPISLCVFGNAPFVSLPANLLAVPVAGFVMTWGIPAGLVAGALPVVAGLVHIPSLIATRWVLVVATLGQRLEPSWPPWCSAVAHVVVLVAILRRSPRAEPAAVASLRDGDPPVHRR
jgi:competence protein ComEC